MLKKIITKIKPYISSFKIQCFALGVFILCIFLTAYISHKRLIIEDPPYQISKVITEEHIKDKKIESYPIRTGILLSNFDEFDLLKNRFILDCIVWFSFNKKKVDIETVNKFGFGNARIIERSPVKVIDLDNNEVFVVHELRVSLKGNLKYYSYPFNDHRLFIVLNNIFFKPNEVFLHSNNNNFELSRNLFVKNLSPIKKYVYFGYNQTKFDKEDSRKQITNPEVVFALDFKQKSFRNVEVIVFPLLILLLIILLSFLLPLTKIILRMTFIFTALSGLLVYRFVIEERIPPVDYYTVIDKIFGAVLITCFLILTLQGLFIVRGVALLEKGDSTLVEHETRLNNMRFINGIVYFSIILSLLVWINLILFV